jgi:hypothetical protein
MTAIASAVSIASALVLWCLAGLSASRTRAIGLVVVLGMTAAAMMAQPFKPARMGDYHDFVQSRGAFESYVGTTVHFQYQLAGTIVYGLDAVFGRTTHSPVKAFDMLARLASFVFVAGLALLALQRRFSARVVRYVAIVLAAPATLLLFGYHEFGYLPDALGVSALPLALIGLEEERNAFVIAGATLLGVGAALHGFGLVAVAFLLLVTLAWEFGEPRRLGTRLAQVIGGAAFGWLVWLALYLVVLGWQVIPDHADFLPIRPLLHTRAVPTVHRYDYAIFSHLGLRDIFFEFVILGVFASAVILFLPGGRLWRAVVAATVPMILFVVFFWPVQGLGNDTDFLGSAFPALYAVGWLTSQSRRGSLVLIAALALGQLALLHVVHGTGFVHAQDF